MKKKIICLSVAAVAAFSLLATGCSAPDASQLISEASEKMDGGSTFDIGMDMAFALLEGDETISFDTTMNMAVETDGTNMKMNGSVTAAGYSTDVETYIVMDGDKVTTYTKSGSDNTWEVVETDTQALSGDAASSLLALSNDWTITEENVTLEDVTATDSEFYRLDNTVGGTEVMEILSSTGGSESISGLDLTSLEFNLTAYIGKDSHELAQLSLDAGETLKDVFEATGLTGVQTATLGFTMKNFVYVADVTIEVPQEVLDQAVSDTTTETDSADTINDLVDSADDTADTAVAGDESSQAQQESSDAE